MMKTKFGIKLMAGASIVSAFLTGAAPMTTFAQSKEVTCICCSRKGWKGRDSILGNE